MTSANQKWAYVEYGKEGVRSEFSIFHHPPDAAGFKRKNDSTPTIRPLEHIVERLIYHHKNSGSGRSPDFYLGFDGERYFAFRVDLNFGWDLVGRPWDEARGYVSESGNFSEDIPLLHARPNAAGPQFVPDANAPYTKRTWLFGHEAMWERQQPVSATNYNTYPPEMGDWVRQFLDKHPQMKERLIEAGRTKTPVAYCLGDGKKLEAFTAKSISLDDSPHTKFYTRTPAPRSAEGEAAPPAASSPRPGFLGGILDPASAVPPLKDQLKQLLDGKLKPDVNADTLIESIMALITPKTPIPPRGGS